MSDYKTKQDIKQIAETLVKVNVLSMELHELTTERQVAKLLGTSYQAVQQRKQRMKKEVKA